MIDFSLSSLDLAPAKHPLRVSAVRAPGAAPEWARWLEEVGFIAGEHVMILTRHAFGGDPMVVRIGSSTFALRRAEAACIDVVAI